MPKVTAYLDCGCAILEGGARVRCPTCEAALESSGAALQATDKYPEHPPEPYQYPLIERPTSQMAIIEEILAERVRQDIKWSEQNHHPFVWLAILGEEKGEADKAALEATYGQDPWSNYRNELIQTAAVALAAIESFDRGKWR